MTLRRPRNLKPVLSVKVAEDPLWAFRVLKAESGMYVGDRYQGVTKLDRVSLARHWRFAGDDLSPVAARDGVVLVAGNDGLYALDENSGEQLWGPRPVGPCVESSHGLFTLRPLGTLDVRKGVVDPQLETSEEFLGESFVAGDVLVGTALKGDPVSAYHLTEKRLIWRRPLLAELSARAGRYEPASVVWAGDDVFVIGRTDMLAGYSLTDGTIRWDTPQGVPYYLPNAAAGRVYVLSAGSTLPARFVCIEAPTGQKVYDIPHPSLRLGNKPFTGTFASEEIVFCTSRNLVIAFSLERGCQTWSYTAREAVGRAISVDQRVLVPTVGGSLLVFEPTT